MSRIAIVAALEREVRPLVRFWSLSDREHEGRRFRFFEHNDAVAVCGGIGPEAARRAAEAVLALYHPEIIYSVGFAGALDPSLKVGDIVQPSRVVNASDGSSTILRGGAGILVSFASIASPDQKKKLRESFGAQAVDMEAASVARAAEARGIRFAALKTISDASNFALPPTERFVAADGSFAEFRFTIFAAMRPWIWPRVIQLARNSSLASRKLFPALSNLVNVHLSEVHTSASD